MKGRSFFDRPFTFVHSDCLSPRERLTRVRERRVRAARIQINISMLPSPVRRYEYRRTTSPGVRMAT